MGIWELLLIALIVLIVAGPTRLPTIMRTVGHWVGRGRATLNSLQSELEREGDELRNDIEADGKGANTGGKGNGETRSE